MASPAYVRTQSEPVRQPPASTTGALAFIRERLFAGPGSTVFTLLALVFLAWVTPPLVRFLITDAVWAAPDGAACRAPGAGACWAYIWRKTPYFIFGSYPEDQRWRVEIAMAAGAVLIAWLLIRRAPWRKVAALLFFVVNGVGLVIFR